MSWRLERTGPIRYRRNPLQLVVVQLRFQTILKVPTSTADFQDIVREDFPVFEEQQIAEVAFNPAAREMLTREEKQFVFKNEDGTTKVLLANDSLAIETTDYSHHGPFLQAFANAVDALLEVFRTVSPTRLGLRYINLIDRQKVASDLGHDLEWRDLVGPDLLSVPGPAGIEESTFKVEVTAPADPGMMTLRHGLIQGQGSPQYRIDIDRYQNGSFEIAETGRLLERFSDDCFDLFKWSLGQELERWMSPLDDSEEVANA